VRGAKRSQEVAVAGKAREHLALYRKNEDLITIGAHQAGANPALDALPADKRAELMKAAAEAGRQVRQQGRAESAEAVAAMEKRGLKVTKPTPEDIADWMKFMDEAYPKIRGNMVPADMFDEVVKLVKEYRAKAK